jgi:hypothetical protein
LQKVSSKKSFLWKNENDQKKECNPWVICHCWLIWLWSQPHVLLLMGVIHELPPPSLRSSTIIMWTTTPCFIWTFQGLILFIPCQLWVVFWLLEGEHSSLRVLIMWIMSQESKNSYKLLQALRCKRGKRKGSTLGKKSKMRKPKLVNMRNLVRSLLRCNSDSDCWFKCFGTNH